MKRTYTVLIPALLLLATSMIIYTGSSEGDLLDEDFQVSRAGIIISGNNQFTLENGVTGGSGTEEEPYMIQNWTIDVENGIGLKIMNSDCQLVIKNCWIRGGVNYDNNFGIYLSHTSNITILNCRIFLLNVGVQVTSSRDISIKNSHFNKSMSKGISFELDVYASLILNNTFSVDNGCGIFLLDHCESNTIQNNTCKVLSVITDSYYYSEGITVIESNNNTIRYNNCVDLDCGIGIIHSDYGEISNNNIINETWDSNKGRRLGIFIEISKNLKFEDNSLINCGMYIIGNQEDEWTSHMINSTNRVNGKPIIYRKNLDSKEAINGNSGQLILANCSGLEISNLSFEGNDFAIQLGYCDNIDIINNEFHDKYSSIGASSCNDLFISGNTFNSSGGIGLSMGFGNKIIENYFINNTRGVSVSRSDSNFINNNSFMANIIGVKIEGSNNTISNNTISSGEKGIDLHRGNYNLISNNRIISHTENGIYCFFSFGNHILRNQILGNGIGIDITSGDHKLTIIEENIISENFVGMELEAGSPSSYSGDDTPRVIGNNISFNENYGIITEGGVKIIGNAFIKNNGGGEQVFDSLGSWDDGSGLGNYWSDYIFKYVPPATNDGQVWNIPYLINGLSGAFDNYPLVSFTGPIGNVLQITTMDDLRANVSEKYSVQYKAYYDGNYAGDIEWSMGTNASWLGFNNSQKLQGKPSVEDIGTFWVNISVSDGFLIDWSNFTISVIHFIQSPIIKNQNIQYVDQGERYHVDYNATGSSTLIWSLDTNCTFLTINSSTGVLTGTPSNSDVGIYWVNVSVCIDIGLSDHTNFTLNVNNVNEPPYGVEFILGLEEFVEEETQIISISVMDPDLQYGDEINITWTINGIGVIGYGETIDLSLSSGKYTLIVRVTDEGGEWVERNITIVVQKKERTDEDEKLNKIIPIVLLLLLLALIIALVFMIKRRRTRDMGIQDIEVPENDLFRGSVKSPVSLSRPLGSITTNGELSGVNHGSLFDEKRMIKDLEEQIEPLGLSRIGSLMDEALEYEKMEDTTESYDELMKGLQIKYNNGVITERELGAINKKLKECIGHSEE